MALIHPNSPICLLSQLDIHTLPPSQTSIESGDWTIVRPFSALQRGSSIDFIISSQSDMYCDVNFTYLKLSAKITTEDNKSYNATSTLSPVNNFFHSIFREVNLSLNQKLVCSSGHNYAYKAYLETLLNYDTTAKNSHLTASLFYNDDNDPDNLTTNNGAKTRRSFTSESKTVHMMGQLHVDLARQQKLIVGGVEIKYSLQLNKEAFCLMGDLTDKPKLHILDATLYVRRMKISPPILIAHQKSLAISNAKYAFIKNEIKVHTIPAGVTSFHIDNCFLGQSPQRIILGCVSNKAYSGDIISNPFNFKHYDLCHLSLFIDGTLYPSKPLQPDFSNGDYIEAYMSLFSGTGIHTKNESNGISRTMYTKGYCLYAFDLTPTLCENAWNLVKNTSVNIELKFRTALPETVSCIVMGEMQQILEISRDRNIFIDFTP